MHPPIFEIFIYIKYVLIEEFANNINKEIIKKGTTFVVEKI